MNDPRRWLVRPHAFFNAGCVLMLASCSSGDGPDPGSSTGDCGEVRSQLRIEDKFRQESATFTLGEPIVLSLRITNDGQSPATLSSPDACASIHWLVLDSRNRRIFDNMPEGTACALVVLPSTYQPGETKASELEWNQTDSDTGGQVPAGRYTVRAHDRSLECRGELDTSSAFAIQ